MIARFQATGAAYERKNFRWLFRTPRHHAERTRKPAPGKNSVTRANSEVALLSAEPGRDDRGERTGGEHPDQHDHGGAAGKEAEGRIGQMRGLRVFAQASQARVYGNEGSRKDSFAEKILKKVGNAKRRVERIGDVGKSEVVSEGALPDEPDETAQQDSGSDEESRARRRGGDRVRTG
jgi:hypothetical protein